MCRIYQYLMILGGITLCSYAGYKHYKSTHVESAKIIGKIAETNDVDKADNVSIKKSTNTAIQKIATLPNIN